MRRRQFPQSESHRALDFLNPRVKVIIRCRLRAGDRLAGNNETYPINQIKSDSES
jgi:hypothetical protein